MLDLDAVLERYTAWADPSPVEGGLDDIEIETRTWKSAKDVPVLVAELRAAQEVITAVPPAVWLREAAEWTRVTDELLSKTFPAYVPVGPEIQLHLGRLADAQAAYDKLTKEAADHGR